MIPVIPAAIHSIQGALAGLQQNDPAAIPRDKDEFHPIADLNPELTALSGEQLQSPSEIFRGKSWAAPCCCRVPWIQEHRPLQAPPPGPWAMQKLSARPWLSR